MSIAFVEYQILPNYRPDYSKWMDGVRANYPELVWLEGTDQPGLFVELWHVSYEEYESLKKARQLTVNDENEQALPASSKYSMTDWEQLGQWVKGGAAKIHIWHFGKVK
ncbi:hypothetical protein DVH26_30395 [Paenibacillus sp. H1-7]|uniref:hypothetical protein n=1 Tax=Paenibacillus sp. H1-7 TaxID=2282849 RepID=UPI001EF8E6B2|nr:hypothetical protein [Paenibacillus sp. H1-7]ULL18398.1 hypothetical protein DVH26_30395 [Paenibacillus sp. H1-7]